MNQTSIPPTTGSERARTDDAVAAAIQRQKKERSGAGISAALLTSILVTGGAFVTATTVLFDRIPAPNQEQEASSLAHFEASAPPLAGMDSVPIDSGGTIASQAPGAASAAAGGANAGRSGSASQGAGGSNASMARGSTSGASPQASGSSQGGSGINIAAAFANFGRAHMDRMKLVKTDEVKKAAGGGRMSFPPLDSGSDGYSGNSAARIYARSNVEANAAVENKAFSAGSIFHSAASLPGRLTSWAYRSTGLRSSSEFADPARSRFSTPSAPGSEVARTFYVTADNIALRSQPSDGDGPGNVTLARLVPGEPLKVLGETKDGWARVQSPRLVDTDDSGNESNTEGWVPESGVNENPAYNIPRPAPAGSTRAAFVRSLLKYQGTQEGANPDQNGKVDGSGLIVRALTDIGANRIPRTAPDQQRLSKELPDATRLRPGDLIFDGSPARHVAAFLGNDQVIEATGNGVVRSTLSDRLKSIRKPHFASLLAN